MAVVRLRISFIPTVAKVTAFLLGTAFMYISASAAVRIKCNQLGFYPDAPKLAVAVGATADSFSVVKQPDGETVFTGVLGAARTWSASGESARLADFSEVTAPGTYLVTCAGCDDSYPFTVASRVHLGVARASIKAFWFNRCSYELTEPFAGVYARPAGHPDTAVEVHPGAASDARPAGTKLSSPGGWYDAGDYGKYIVNSGISTWSLFAAYEAFPGFYDTLNLDFPESANNLPDLLDEALFNFRWMLTMQDPADGGVYHKLTTANFSGMVMPEDDKATRYVVAKSTAATLDFAAVCAQAARIFRKFESELPGFSDSCLVAAQLAWEWARENPSVAYHNSAMTNPAVSTGEYGDRNFSDELLWAATELFIATKRDSFFTVAFPQGTLSGVNRIPGWPNVGTLALYSLYLCGESFETVSAQQVREALAALADSSTKLLDENAYRISMSDRDFNWGSNSMAGNRGMSLLFGYLATGEESYREAALDQLDYLLGRNPTGYSWVTGYGSHTPMFIHHRPSDADGIEAPVPGFLAGGPNPWMQDTIASACGYGTYPASLPAVAYFDNVCSYASNEIAINWNAPLVFLAGGIEALYGKDIADPVIRAYKKKGHSRDGLIRLLRGRVSVNVPAGEAIVTVATLRGRVLYRTAGSGAVGIVPDWPLQTVVVTVQSVESHAADQPMRAVLVAGRQ